MAKKIKFTANIIKKISLISAENSLKNINFGDLRWSAYFFSEAYMVIPKLWFTRPLF